MHHELCLAATNDLGDLLFLAGAEHIDAVGEVESELVCLVSQVLHCIAVCQYLLAECVHDSIYLRRL